MVLTGTILKTSTAPVCCRTCRTDRRSANVMGGGQTKTRSVRLPQEWFMAARDQVDGDAMAPGKPRATRRERKGVACLCRGRAGVLSGQGKERQKKPY